MKLLRYLTRDVLTHMVAVSFVLLIVIFSGRFVKYLAEAAVGALYRHARAGIYVSHHEGFGIPPLEALGWTVECVPWRVPGRDWSRYELGQALGVLRTDALQRGDGGVGERWDVYGHVASIRNGVCANKARCRIPPVTAGMVCLKPLHGIRSCAHACYATWGWPGP